MHSSQIAKGNSGEDDEHIQMLTVQAQEVRSVLGKACVVLLIIGVVQGDVQSMLSLGELFYFGTRGLGRDQVRAFIRSMCVHLGNTHPLTSVCVV